MKPRRVRCAYHSTLKVRTAYPILLLRLVTLLLSLVVTANAHSPDQTSTLRVCADPNNLPFSNERGEGFENRLAQLVARELGAQVEYTWWAQRRGFLRNTLNAGRCDVVMDNIRGPRTPML